MNTVDTPNPHPSGADASFNMDDIEAKMGDGTSIEDKLARPEPTPVEKIKAGDKIKVTVADAEDVPERSIPRWGGTVVHGVATLFTKSALCKELSVTSLGNTVLSA
jgi:hypothetical protein